MDTMIDVPTQKLNPIKGVKKLPLEEFFTSGHRTCQGCESALVRKMMAISAALTHPDYNLLILMYDNESYANTDIQLSGSTPYGAHTTFSPPGKMKRIMHRRWKKNMAGMLAAGHPTCKYVATVCMSYAL